MCVIYWKYIRLGSIHDGCNYDARWKDSQLNSSYRLCWIPIYADQRNNVIGILFAADLALLKRDEKMTIDTFLKNHRHRRHMVTEETTLRTIIDEFDKVDDSGIFVVEAFCVFLQNDFRMAIVIRKIDQIHRTPYYETTGIVTLTDIMEEICHAEISFAHRN